MLWALSDPHLSFGVEGKPMDVFGPAWADHAVRLARHWRERVGPDDWVLLPGDLSWGMSLAQASPDLAFLHALPGNKLLGRGNHDYWWTGLQKMQRYCAAQAWSTLYFQRMDVYPLPLEDGRRVLVCGTRGWTLPGERGFSADQEKIFVRECLRLETSLRAMAAVREPEDAVVCALHYPPLLRHRMRSALTDLLEAYRVPLCLYGHLHGRGILEAYEGEVRGVLYCNVAADRLGMRVLPVPLCSRLP